MDPNREAYPFAGALCVAAGELLTRLHEVTGPPPTSAEDLSDHDRALAVAAAAGYGASAACAALAGRLLLIERAASRALIPEVAEAGLPEAGITTLDPVESRAWRQTVWAAAATRVELERCAAALSAQGAPDMPGVVRELARLIDYVDELTGVLERIEPQSGPDAETERTTTTTDPTGSPTA